jgi:hypothetical protein
MPETERAIPPLSDYECKALKEGINALLKYAKHEPLTPDEQAQIHRIVEESAEFTEQVHRAMTETTTVH